MGWGKGQYNQNRGTIKIKGIQYGHCNICLQLSFVYAQANKKIQTKEKSALYIYWLLSLTGVLYLDICSSSMLGVWYTALDQNACISLLTVAQYPTLQNSTTFRTKLHLLQLEEGSVQIHTDLFRQTYSDDKVHLTWIVLQDTNKHKKQDKFHK